MDGNYEELDVLAGELLECQLEVLNRLIGYKRGEEDLERVVAALASYDDARRRLRLLIADTPALTLPGAEHAFSRGILQEVLSESTPVDRVRKTLGIDGGLTFTDEELDPVAQNYLAWFSHWDYAQARLEGSVLVLRAGSLPGDLNHLISEIQECYAFQRGTAVVSLCRTALEVGLRPIYSVNHLHDPYSANSAYVRDKIYTTRARPGRKRHLTEDENLYSDKTADDFSPTIDQMITRLCWLPRYSEATVGERLLRDAMHHLRDKANAHVHGNASEDSVGPKPMMATLFQCLHALYEIDPHEDGVW